MEERVQTQGSNKANATDRMAKLLAMAKPQKISNTIPIVRYYRSMIEAHRMAVSYMNSQDLERALVLLIRFCRDHIQAEEIKRSLRLKFENEAAEAKKSIHQAGQEFENASIAHVPEGSSAFVSSAETIAIRIINPGVNTSDISFPGLSAPSSSTNITNLSTKRGETPSAPHIDRSNKPNNVFHSVCGAVSNRVVLIPGDLIKKFLICAEDNTLRNIETCGTLCGTIIGCELVVSHVILPKQTGASDGCYAEGEEEVFAYQNKHDLITLGWIHTHPSQTAFLSSVDLHTHCAYQIMLNEAIAIVCAPTHNQVGTFVLSSYGMSVVESCTKAGFHLHPDAEKLFLEAEHVRYSGDLSITIVDMRH
ncbi:unnamed protein product [Angiostrongylus costaricensis]|uniref:MPN domain-containing protein n=1 Tax=Angiostrongylus costaricensis TaxID=334426 RepID=A0A0R3PDG1_ANGCS|nr:unnamed protein product [Angiostrongylus costaricensis]